MWLISSSQSGLGRGSLWHLGTNLASVYGRARIIDSALPTLLPLFLPDFFPRASLFLWPKQTPDSLKLQMCHKLLSFMFLCPGSQSTGWPQKGDQIRSDPSWEF